MPIDNIEIGNFRKLQAVRIDLAERTTVFVGANNSGKARTMRANQRAAELREVIENAEQRGHITLRQLAHYLNELGIASAYGGQWHPNSVRRIQQRAGHAGAKPLQLIAQETA